jgi:hypothetical protein
LNNQVKFDEELYPYRNQDMIEGIFQALLEQNSDELLIKAQALIAKINMEVKCGSDDQPIRVKGLPNSIDPNKPLRNYRDAMTREDRQEWAVAYMEEHQSFHGQGTLQVARPEPGSKILDITTRADYKVTNGLFDNRKIRLCVCANFAVISRRKELTTIPGIYTPLS